VFAYVQRIFQANPEKLSETKTVQVFLG